MPLNLTPANVFTDPVAVPVTGEARSAASVEVPFQALTNRTHYLNDQKNLTNANLAALKGVFTGLHIGAKNAYSNGNNIIVHGFQLIYIDNVAYAAQAEETVTPGSDSNDTWHYLYAYEALGVIEYTRSTTGPDPSHTFKSDDDSRVFICSYYVDGSGNIRPFRKVGSEYTWRRSGIANYGVGSTSSTGYVDLNLSAWMSPLSRLARIEALVTDATNGTADYRTKGDTANVTKTLQADGNLSAEFEIETDSSRLIQHRVQSGTAPFSFVFAIGYRE
jgi:hypothetical protein